MEVLLVSKQKEYSKITESRNPNTFEIDKMSTLEIINIINDEDLKVIEAIRNELGVIENAIDKITERMKKGGRLIYIGTGTSGRIGILDAVECVPTFNTEADWVSGVLAGGKEAMFEARENLEDDQNLGISDVKKEKVAENDEIVGISASGSTPYVMGAVDEARRRNALTIGLACNKNAKLKEKVDIAILPIVGPEVITGSTRMKAGTAQKLILNMISTTVMIKLGKVYSNLMVDLKPTNQKLRKRASTIFMEITDASEEKAKQYLKKSNYDVKVAVIMFIKNVSYDEAEKMLKENNCFLRNVIQ